MSAREISATEFARNLSSLLNEVCYQGVSLDVRRGKDIVARVSPPEPVPGFPIGRLNEFFASLPRLTRGDADDFLEDLEALDRTLVGSSDPWAS